MRLRFKGLKHLIMTHCDCDYHDDVFKKSASTK